MDSIDKLIKELIDAGHDVKLDSRGLLVDGKLIPLVRENESPYMTDCPDGKCNI